MLVSESRWRRWFAAWPDFVVWPDTAEWDDGSPVSDDERQKLIRIVQDSARRHKMTLKID
jgi:hypothetical protein